MWSSGFSRARYLGRWAAGCGHLNWPRLGVVHEIGEVVVARSLAAEVVQFVIDRLPGDTVGLNAADQPRAEVKPAGQF